MKKSLLPILWLFISFIGYAQSDDSTAASDPEKRMQSLNEQLEAYERMLSESNLKQKQDSLARVELMTTIQLLQENDKVNQATLREQIRAIEQRDSLRSVQQKQRILTLRKETKGYHVAPFGDSLLTIFTKLGPVMAEERASNVTEKIEMLVSDDFFYPDSLSIEEHDGTLDLMYLNIIVISVSDWDVLWVQEKSQYTLASLYKKCISEYVIKTRSRSSIDNIAARIGLVFLIIGGVALILYFIGKLANGIQGWMVINKNQFFTGIQLRNFELLPPSLHLDVSIRVVSALKWALYALVFYFSLPLIFGLFPFTRGWAQTLMDWILSPARNAWYGFWNYLPNVFTIAVIYLITSYLVKFLKFIAGEVHSGTLNLAGFYSEWALPTYRLAKILIYAFMVVVIYPYLPGSESDIFKGVSIFFGLLIVFGSTSAVSNVVAGLVITYMRPFRVGDRIKIGEVTGEIVEKALLVTRVRTDKNEDITVPNSTVLTGHTINYTSSSKELGLILNTSISIGYQVPWKQVHELLIEAAASTEGVNVTREPFVLQTKLNDSQVTYQVNAYTDIPNRTAQIYSDLHANIQDKFNEAGIEIVVSD